MRRLGDDLRSSRTPRAVDLVRRARLPAASTAKAAVRPEGFEPPLHRFVACGTVRYAKDG